MDLSQIHLNFLLADVSRLMRRAFEQRLTDSPLTFAQVRVLIYATRNEGLRQIELAEMLEVQPITLARLVDQLVDLMAQRHTVAHFGGVDTQLENLDPLL